MSEREALKSVAETSLLSRDIQERVLAVYDAQGWSAAVAALDAAAAPELKARKEQYDRDMAELERTIAELSMELRATEDALEQEHIAALTALPPGASKARDAAWDAYYQKCDDARAAHERKARELIGRLVGASHG